MSVLARQCRLFGTHSFCIGGLSGSTEGQSYNELETSYECYRDKEFSGLAGYYRKFVEGFSKIAAPLTRLTRKEEPFFWSEACQQSFDELKRRLTSALVLTLPSG